MFSILIKTIGTTVMIGEMKIVMHKGTIMTSVRKMIMMKMRMTMMMWAILITTHND